jgi:hypothetical protein
MVFIEEEHQPKRPKHDFNPQGPITVVTEEVSAEARTREIATPPSLDPKGIHDLVKKIQEKSNES